MRVRPKPGMMVRHPETKEFLPADGIDVDPADFYWNRRIRQGDVEIVPGIEEEPAP